MADNDTAALVVALSAQLTRFEKDMKGAVDIADKRTKEIETRFEKMNSVISSKAQLLSSSAIGNLGFAGALISSLGPAGIVAATGLGAAVAAMFALVNATSEYTEKAARLKDAAETAGITITQMKLLAATGKTVGFDFEASSAFVAKFLANLEALRKGGGPLYDALLKIDTGLLDQLSVTKDSAKAIDLLISAFARLGVQSQKLDLAKAAGGKGGLEGVRFLDALGKAGGLAGLQATTAPFDEGQVERAVQLRREIDAIRSRIGNVWGGMFSDNILLHEKEMAEDLLKIAQFLERIAGAKERAARAGNADGAQADDLVAERKRLQDQIATLEAAATSKPIDAAKTAQEELKRALEQERGWTKDEIAKLESPPAVALDGVKKRLVEIDQQLDKIREKFGGTLPSAIAAVTPPPPKPVSLRTAREGISELAPTDGSPATQLDRLQKNIAVLGEAVTAGEQWRRKNLEIKIAEDAGGLSSDTRARALAAFTLTMRAATIATLERLNIASQQEIVEGKLIQLEKDRIKNGLTAAQVERGKAAIMREVNDAANATRERLAIATEQQIVETRLNQLAQDRVKNGLTENEVQKATVVILREARDAADALTVRQAYLPGLKQLENDARSLRKGLDEVSVSGLNSFTDGLADIVTRTKTVSNAVSDMVSSVLRDFARMAIRQGITGPLAGLLQSGIKGLLAGGGPASAFTGSAVGADGANTLSFGGPRAGGGGVNSGTGYLVGEDGPELFVPGANGMIMPNNALSGQRSGGTTIAPVYNIDASGADPASIARMERALMANTRAIADQQRAVVSASRENSTGVR